MRIMNLIFLTVLSMSLSGSLLILALFLGRRFWKGRLGRQWQYYIWLIVLLRLFLPFGPEASLMGQVHWVADGAHTQMTQELRLTEQGNEQGQMQGPAQSFEKSSVQNKPQFTGAIFSKALAFIEKYLWVIWLAVAFAMLIQKITVYRSYIRYVTAGAKPIDDTALLDGLAAAMQKMEIGRQVELCANPLVASPMLIGYFHPCIVLPRDAVSEKEFQYMAMHELTHYKCRDIVYKWLVQLAVCLHWFNPFVYVMRREIDRACEFACDEAVVRKMGYDHAKDYGKTLLDAMASRGICREPLAAVTMSANKELLKERLGAIMNCKKKTKVTGMITAGLTAAIVAGAVWIGVYPTAAAEPGVKSDKDAIQEKPEETDGEAWTDAETYYRNRSLPQFYIAFGELDEKAQEIWLDRFYADRELQFFSVCVMALDTDSSLIQSFAQRFYEEDDAAFFSVLAKAMSEDMLEEWLDRALKDEKWTFQSMLYDDLGLEEEKDALEEEWDKKQTEAEVKELHGDMYGDEEEDSEAEADEEAEETGAGVTGMEEQDSEGFPREMVVNMPVCRIRAGAGEGFPVVDLIAEGEKVTVLGKKEGSGGTLWYLLDQESLSEKPDPETAECYIRADLLE